MKHFSTYLKLSLLVLMAFAFSFNSNAQSERVANSVNPFAESHSSQITNSSNQSVLPPPMWDVQASIDVTAATSVGGQAGVVWVGNEYWVSEWASANIHRLDSLGNLIATFTVPGLTGTRGMSYDGSSVWMGNATNTITEVDPVTLGSLGTITIPAANSARQISYDATANGGLGGLWVANVFGTGPTDILLVDLSGNLLVTIPQTTHTLSGIYGFAVDNLSTGGPYLWTFSQPANPGAIITQLALPAGTPTGVSFDVNADLGLAGIAGGIFIDTTIVPGEMSIGCLLQDNPDILTVYELDFTPINFDCAAEELTFDPPYTQIPLSQVGPMTFDGNASNRGLMALTNAKVEILVNSSAGAVFSDSVTIPTIPTISSSPYSFGPFTPSGLGGYDVDIITSTDPTQVDGDPSNNNEFGTFAVTDSTMARDNGIHNGGNGYAVSGTDWGYALTMFDVPNADTLTSVTIELEIPLQGDTTYAVLVNSLGGYPGFITDIGNIQIISGAQNVYTLTFPLGGVVLPAGTYGIGVYEGNGTTINLRQSDNIYTAGTNYFQVGSTPGVWTASGIETARFIRPNFGIAPLNIGINELNNIEANISVYPNPSTGTSEVYFDLEDALDLSIKIYDSMGRMLSVQQLENILRTKMVIDLAGQSNGLYFIEINTEYGNIVKKLMLNK